MLSSNFQISASHPCLADHFPGQPIAPGVLTLDLVTQGLIQHLPGKQLAGFPQVKFLKPVLPEQIVTVKYVLKKDDLYQFQCVSGTDILVTGQIRLQEKDVLLG